MAGIDDGDEVRIHDLIITGANFAAWNYNRLRCTLGAGGVVDPAEKVEGDKKTPAGRWPMRQILYRADRLTPVISALPVRALTPSDGWNENPADPHYNTLVKLDAATEQVDRLWREDGVYDVIVVLGYNDDPIVAGRGSAIFLHVARPDFMPTAGCIALPLENLLTVIREAEADSAVVVPPTVVG